MSKDRKDIIGYKYKDDEAELREQIAKTLEARASETYYDEKEIWLEAAAIARGTND